MVIAVLVFLATPSGAYWREIKQNVVSFGPRMYWARWRALESPDLIQPQRAIIAGTKSTDCIQAVYGWAIGSVYFYAQRQPCARHFIPNIITDDYVPEYRASLLAHPPRAIYYTEAGADLTIAQFERRVFPYRPVLQQCYQQDSRYPEVFWPQAKLSDQAKLSACIQAVLTTQLEQARQDELQSATDAAQLNTQ